jgi:hypothetical protein
MINDGREIDSADGQRRRFAAFENAVLFQLVISENQRENPYASRRCSENSVAERR